jgi:hypothetical protein
MEVHLQSARSQPKTTEPAIDKALEVLNKLHGIDEKSLASAKKLCKRTVPTIRNYRTTSQLADKCSGMILTNLYKQFSKMT